MSHEPVAGPASVDGGRAVARSALAALLLPLAAACATMGPRPPEGSALPPVPRVDGPPRLYVAYPDSLARVAARDSNFIFGTAGTGAAELEIDGRPVEVQPNGAFLAWLPVPPAAAADTARYRLVARAGGQADTLVHPVLLPLDPPGGEGRVWIDTAAAESPLPERWALPDAPVEASVRAAPGLEAWVEVVPPRETAEPPARFSLAGDSAGRYRTEVPAWQLAAAATPPDAVRDAAGEDGAAADTAPAAVRGAAEDAAGAPAAPRRPGGRRLHEAPAPDPGPRAAPDTLRLRFVVTDGRDTASVRRRLPFRLLNPAALPVAVLAEAPDSVHGSSGAVVARPSARGSYAWRFPEGSVAPVDARLGDRLRLRLGGEAWAWVAAEDARVPARPAAPPPEEPAGEGDAPPRGDGGRRQGGATGVGATAGGADGPPDASARGALRATVGPVTVQALDDRIRVRLRVSRRLPADARPSGPRRLSLTVYGGLGATERMSYGPADPLLASLAWEQLPGPRYRLDVGLAGPVWGWRLWWEEVPGEGWPAPPDEGMQRPAGSAAGAAGSGGARPPGEDLSERAPRARDIPDPGAPGTLVLEVRRPPRVDPDRPLRGRRVAVDPGHPPVGAEGPTGLTEAEANLGVARRLAELLREAGARPVLLREDDAPVGLYQRRARAVEAGAELLVSIHNNALPDGVRPFGREGTSTYYFHAHALGLAREVQEGMLRWMGLRDLGVYWGNLALPRETWMPSVLAEGAFMMFPRHEAALRTASFRDAYARGVLEGLRDFLRSAAAVGDGD